VGVGGGGGGGGGGGDLGNMERFQSLEYGCHGR